MEGKRIRGVRLTREERLEVRRLISSGSIEGDIERLTEDSAYDTLAIYDASAARGIEAEAIIARNVLNRMIAIGRPESLVIAD